MEGKDWSGGFFFNESNRLYNLNQKRLLDFFSKSGCGITLLDLGCADLRYTLEVSERLGAEKVITVDLEDKVLPEDATTEIDFIKHDLNKPFPLDDESVDVVSANQILEHLWNTHNFFKELYRVLRPGGYAVISTPNLSSLHSLTFILLGQQPPILHHADVQVGNFLRGTRVDMPHHIRAYNIPAMSDLGRHYDFKVDMVSGYGFYFLPEPLQNPLSRILGRYAVYINARMGKK
jgi:SAM-dependent methyltransferase